MVQYTLDSAACNLIVLSDNAPEVSMALRHAMGALIASTGLVSMQSLGINNLASRPTVYPWSRPPVIGMRPRCYLR